MRAFDVMSLQCKPHQGTTLHTSAPKWLRAASRLWVRVIVPCNVWWGYVVDWLIFVSIVDIYTVQALFAYSVYLCCQACETVLEATPCCVVGFAPVFSCSCFLTLGRIYMSNLMSSVVTVCCTLIRLWVCQSMSIFTTCPAVIVGPAVCMHVFKYMFLQRVHFVCVQLEPTQVYSHLLGWDEQTKILRCTAETLKDIIHSSSTTYSPKGHSGSWSLSRQTLGKGRLDIIIQQQRWGKLDVVHFTETALTDVSTDPSGWCFNVLLVFKDELYNHNST